MDDADGDGFNNLLEYGFGSAAGDVTRIPQAIKSSWASDNRVVTTNPDGSRRGPGGREIPADCIGFYDLKIPYITGLVDARLEYSDDLVEWKLFQQPLFAIKPAASEFTEWDGWPDHTATHQAVPIPVTATTRGVFFRVKTVLED